MESSARIFIVDAFTNEPFRGNPAGVCYVPGVSGKFPFTDIQLQNIASEMNQAETSFIVPLDSSTSSDFHLRWFTPTVEVPLCGHGTLSAAAVVFQEFDGACGDLLSFQTLSGVLTARRIKQENKPDIIQLEMPLNPPEKILEWADSSEATDSTISTREKVVRALVATFRMEREAELIKEVWYNSTTKKLLVLLNETNVTRDTLEGFVADPSSMTQVDQRELPEEERIKGVMLTVKGTGSGEGEAGQAHNFLTRYFAPWVGINEDAVTGSAHTVLAPFWRSVYRENGGGSWTTMYARQCSKRGGDLHLHFDDDKPEQVYIGGSARIVLQGTMDLSAGN